MFETGQCCQKDVESNVLLVTGTGFSGVFYIYFCIYFERQDNAELVTALLHGGSDVQQLGGSALTALHVATLAGHHEVRPVTLHYQQVVFFSHVFFVLFKSPSHFPFT